MIILLDNKSLKLILIYYFLQKFCLKRKIFHILYNKIIDIISSLFPGDIKFLRDFNWLKQVTSHVSFAQQWGQLRLY